MDAFGWLGLPYSILGFVVGLLVGVTGVGGGSLMTPLLILLFGVHPAVAVGTDLLFAAATKSAGTVVHGINHNVDWRVTGYLALGSLPATAVTLLVLSSLDLEGGGANRLLKAVLFAALLLTAGSLLARDRMTRRASAPTVDAVGRRTATLTVLTGLVLGVLVSLSSVGAGAVGMIALLLLYPQRPTARLVGSDIAHAVPLTLLAGIGHWLMGTVNWGLLGLLLVGSLPGIVLGSYASARVPDIVLRTVLAATLLLVAGKMVL